MELTGENLYKEYIDNKRSTRECAKAFGVTQSLIMRRMRYWNIPSRSYKENKMPLKKGDKMPESQKENISKAMVDNPRNYMLGRTLEKHPQWKGGTRVYRRMKLSEVPLVCTDCGARETIRIKTNLHVHHIDGDRENNKLDNLQVLCASCHKKKHLKEEL